MEKIPNVIKTGVLALLFSVILFGVALAAKDEMPDVAAKETMNVTYGLDSNGPGNFWPDNSLKEVFLRYWKANLSSNWEEAQKLEAPYFLEMTDPIRYKMYLTSGRKRKLIELQLDQFAWEEKQLCRIKMVLHLQLGDGKVEKVHVSDWWVKAGGEWYHVVRDPFFFPGV